MTKQKNPPRSISELSHATAEMLRAEINDPNRFKSMDLCNEIMDRCDLVSHRDQLMLDTLRSWIGKIQERFQT